MVHTQLRRRPAYPNLQHIQYAIVHFFTLIMNPWIAILAMLSLITYNLFPPMFIPGITI